MNEPAPNLAARAGRWSAQHRRKAILGWLVFVVLAVAVGGALGTKTLVRPRRESASRAAPTACCTTRGWSTPRPRRSWSPPRRAAPSTRRSSRTPWPRSPRPRSGSATSRSSASRGSATTSAPRSSSSSSRARSTRPATPSSRSRWRSTTSSRPTSASGSSRPATARSPRPTTTRWRATSRRPSSSASRSRSRSSSWRSARSSPPASPSCSASRRRRRAGAYRHPEPGAAHRGARLVVLLLIGLAVGVDYALFYLRREREERAAGKGRGGRAGGRRGDLRPRDPRLGLHRDGRRSRACSRPAASGTPRTRSAIIIVVAIAMAGSVTVLPAAPVEARRPGRARAAAVHPAQALRRGRPRLERDPRPRPAPPAGRRRRRHRRAARAGRARRSASTSRPGHRLAPPGPPRRSTRFERAQQAFPGGSRPARRRGPGRRRHRARPSQRAIDHLGATAGEAPGHRRPLGSDVSPDRTVARVAIPLAGDGVEDRSEEALDTLREDVLPATLRGRPTPTPT